MSTLEVNSMAVALARELSDRGILEQFVKGCEDPAKYFRTLTTRNIFSVINGGFGWGTLGEATGHKIDSAVNAALYKQGGIQL